MLSYDRQLACLQCFFTAYGKNPFQTLRETRLISVLIFMVGRRRRFVDCEGLVETRGRRQR